jgi:uncharacterized protein YjbJ (UPF0337 family)
MRTPEHRAARLRCAKRTALTVCQLRMSVMDWDRIEGNWKQFTGKVKEKWGDLTDDEIAQTNGKREQLEGLVQKKYGYAKDKAREEVDAWSRDLK